MLHLTDVTQPKEGEQVERVIRRHRLTLALPLMLAAACIVAPFFFLFSLPQLGVGGIVGFVVLLAIGIVLALRAFVMWDADALILTTHRLIRVDQQGIWHRVVTEVALAAIQDVQFEQHGIWDVLSQMGAVRVRTAGGSNELVAKRLWRPQRVRELILERAHPASPSDRRRHIDQLLEHASEEAVQAIETLLEGIEPPKPV